jgi:HK97 family phage portal protein
MPQDQNPPRSLTSKSPSWSIKTAFQRFNPFAKRIDPEVYTQEQGGITMSRYGVTKGVGGKFSEIATGNQFNIERPSAGTTIDPAKALANNRGFVYASMNAIAREVMTIDWRLFQVSGKNHKEQTEHEVLDLLDTVNDSMISLAFKYLLSACLTLTGNSFVYLEGVSSDLDKPKAIHLMPPDKVRPVIDRRSWPFQVLGYKMKFENLEMAFQPYEVIHLQLPNPSDFFSGMSPVQAGAEYIDNDNYAQEFNRMFFKNGARPVGFLETNMLAETQLDALREGFMAMHQGLDNMNRIGILPKDVKWSPTGSSPKDMDFKNLSEDSKERILSVMGVSKTILGTAESDTNRATAETADYVFSKRVVKPHMLLICAFLNERLIPRYGDNLYLSFIDPVPEDRAARTTEMATASGGVPIITQNEARDEFMGLGPVDGGDKLLIPNLMHPAGEEQPAGDIDPDAAGSTQAASKRAKRTKEVVRGQRNKAANGERVAFRMSRTKLQKRAEMRKSLASDLAEKIKADLKAKLDNPTKKFASTKEQDEARWKEFSEYTAAAEAEVAEVMRKINGEQKKEVLANLPAVTKAIDPAKLFDVKNWISITTDAVTPIMETLFEHQGKAAATEVGKPDLNPFNDLTGAAVKRSVQMMSESYNQTTLATLETQINAGVTAGESLADITKRVEQIYEWSDNSRAATVAKTESFRTANSALKSAWQQSGVVKTVRWYNGNNPCAFCAEMNGKTVSIDDNFFDEGDSLTVGEGDDAKTMTFDFGDVGSPPCHPNCFCFIRPDSVSID